MADRLWARVDTARATVPHPWWWDGAFGAGFVVLAVATVVVWPVRFGADWAPVAAAPPAARLAVALALAGGSLLRTRRPAGALVTAIPLVVLDACLGFSPVGAFVLVDLLYCTVLYGSARTSAVTLRATFGFWTVGVGVLGLLTGSLHIAAQTGLASATLLLLPVLWAREVRRPVEAAAAERAAAAQAARIAELDRREAVAEERARIARDLHDTVAGHLSAISLQSQAALRGDGAARETVLHAVRENSVRALAEMRALIEVLRSPPHADGATPDPVPAASRLDALPALVHSARAAGLAVEVVEDTVVAVDLPSALDVTAYRITQEALTNAATHAPGAEVRLRFEPVAGRELTVEIENTRTAAAASPGTGTGLEGMRIRAEAVGGHLEAGPVGDDRWRVRARLPWAVPS